MLKVIELFAGVGSQTQALKNIGVKHEVIGISEIDKYAISSYTQLHGETHNFGDISKIDILPKADLWTYSFPCQDLSVAGKGAGIKEGTRSGLLLQVERLLELSEKPKYLLMENVKNLIGKKNKADFDRWCDKLESLGYTNYFQVLNAKDYGIPQNRERIFMVSILGEHKPYVFPAKEELKLRLKDMLEDNVDSKYFINKDREFSYNKKDKHDENEVARICGGNFKTTRTVCDINKNCRCLDTMGGDQREPKILLPNQEISYCLDASYFKGTSVENFLQKKKRQIVNDKINFRIRKLTPRECWRLMGWTDEQFDKIKGVSNTQLYKQAGNGIVVTVLEKIFKNLLF